jgi:hypothetical protein
MNRRIFITLIGALAIALKTAFTRASMQPSGRPSGHIRDTTQGAASAAHDVLIVGVGDGGCVPLLQYEASWRRAGQSSTLLYVARTAPAGRCDHFVSLDYGETHDSFESFVMRLPGELDAFVQEATSVIVVFGLAGSGLQRSMAISNLVNIARKAGKHAVAIVSNPFSFEGNHREGVAQAALKRWQEQFDAILTLDADWMFDLVEKPLRLEDAYRMLDEVMASRLDFAYRILASGRRLKSAAVIV